MKQKVNKNQFYFGTERKFLQDLSRPKVIENKKKKAAKEACRSYRVMEF